MGTPAAAIRRNVYRLMLGFNPGQWRYTIHQVRASRVKPADKIRCRMIESADLEGIVDLLTIGFIRTRKKAYWQEVIRRLSARTVPDGYPRYGYMIEAGGKPVGVLLMICTMTDGAVRCHESSYYVEPPYRPCAPLLVRRAHHDKTMTYVNVTPSPHTWTTLEAQGYRRFAQGVFLTMPMRCPSNSNVRVTRNFVDPKLTQDEIEMLARHNAYGCVSMICERWGEVHPLIFAVRHKWGMRYGHLIYSRNQDDFAWMAGAIKGVLLQHGILVGQLDANGPLDLPGMYFESPKSYVGPNQPRLGDLTYSEMGVFGAF